MRVVERLRAQEAFSCKKCIYFDPEGSCRFSNSDIVKKSPDDWCGEGRWLVRYKDGLWLDSLTGIVMVRAQREFKRERKLKVRNAG